MKQLADSIMLTFFLLMGPAPQSHAQASVLVAGREIARRCRHD
jgi:hypothetical protein